MPVTDRSGDELMAVRSQNSAGTWPSRRPGLSGRQRCRKWTERVLRVEAAVGDFVWTVFGVSPCVYWEVAESGSAGMGLGWRRQHNHVWLPFDMDQ